MTKLRKFPFVPKSNKFLMPGDFVGIPLPNEQWACAVILGRLLSGRSAFIGGLFEWVGSGPPCCSSIDGAQVPHYSSHHIKTISSYGLSIDGNCRLDQSNFELRQQSFDVYQGGLFDHSRRGADKQDRSIKKLGAMNMGGLYARAIRLYGGMDDTEEIRLYLGSLRESLAQTN